MSLLTIGKMSDGFNGTAPDHYVASTPDNLVTITTAEYLNYLGDTVKNNDYMWINYSDTTVLPAQISATPGFFRVQYSAPNMSLVQLPFPAVIGSTQYDDITVVQAGLAAAGHVQLIAGVTGAQFKIRNMFLNSGGTNFSGGGGDRNLSITDGVTVYSVIPAATLQALANAGWGSVALPYPASAPIDQLTAPEPADTNGSPGQFAPTLPLMGVPWK